MEESNNNNQSQTQKNINDFTSHTKPAFNLYINPYPILMIFLKYGNTEIANILREINSNTESQIRLNRDGIYINFAIAFLVLIFIA